MSALERAELVCQERDAAALKRGLAVIWRLFSTQGDPSRDRMQQAKLACQMRDLQQIIRALDKINNRGQAPRPVIGGAARA